ncbi:MAG: ferrous iron transport protein A [Clostridia bacterium]|nr:ferrous iron transport protein A [Clostridia bacterium]
MTRCSLDMLPVGEKGVICSIDNTRIKNRILDLGFTKNTEISTLRKSPAGDPTAYLVKGSVIALRCEDARSINVSINNGD